MGGHSIPLDRGALETLYIVGVINEAEQAAGSCPWPGAGDSQEQGRGVRFAVCTSLAAEVVANPFSTNLHKLLLEIAPDAKERLPKRQAKKPEPPPEPPKKPAVAAQKKAEPPAVAETKAAAVPAPVKKKPPEPAKKPLLRKPLEAPAKKKAPDMIKKKPSVGIAKKKPR